MSRGKPPRMSNAAIEEPAFLFPDATVAAQPQHAAGTLDDDLRAEALGLVRLLASRGLDVLVLDQTRADVGMPVVKVVVPGLRPFWARFGPGRLYDVPAALGWVAQPVVEATLNPSHLVI